MKSRRRPVPTLQARLDSAEATLEAIRTGEVDALVITGPGGARTLAIEGATHPYHVLLDAMNDGAALYDTSGTILFANRRLAELAGSPVERLQGTRFSDLLAVAFRPGFAELQAQVTGLGVAAESVLARRDRSTVPVAISLSALPDSPGRTPSAQVVLMAIVVDLTERRRAEALRADLVTRLITVEDEERRRIARELHDETGQSLTALLVGLRAIEERTQLAEIVAAAQHLRGIAAQTVDNVGRLARGLHPSVLDDLGLLAAIRRYVSDYTKSFGIAVDLTSEGITTAPLPALVQTTIFRILQEALTNVVRHAEAERVRVDLRLDGPILEVVVADDGRGFDAAHPSSDGRGLGLHGMGERAVLLGGGLDVESRPGAGTTLRARVPLAGTVVVA